MTNLSKAEEQLMEYIWKHEKIFLKELIECFPVPKPAAATVATFLKRMINKGFVEYKVYGNSREYFPLISKADYLKHRFNGLIKNNFNDSALQLASFFTTAADLTTEELKKLRKIVDQEIQKKEE
ncbi:MAG: BlaI/MecI/CopY family transcriptional regulator [Chitinophagaceae bacterium]|nr:BlaI/MecI/CopY family transcriptional regulator [Chitinophagaceae bacterium]MCW5925394.1 BlaI/MecI/CopY family transcriptional regulator [Chitinophagaceae bacterium]